MQQLALTALALVLLALAAAAPPAPAAGINLEWDHCYSGAGSATDKVSLCDVASNADLYRIYGSAVTGVAIPDFYAQSNVIDVAAEHEVLSDWWGLAAGECRAGSLVINYALGPAVTGCDKTLISGSIIPLWDYARSPTCTKRARLRLVATRLSGTAVSATRDYALFEIVIDGQKSAVDPGDPSSSACAGCQDPATIIFSSCQLQGVSGNNLLLTSPNNSPYGRQHVTWQGGGCLIDCLPCPVSTHRPTWGMLKSLYR